MDYTVIIGSYARGTYTPSSDFDVVRIGHTCEVDPCVVPSSAPIISYIDYSPEHFAELYSEGALFFHHVFSEGILIHGSRYEWHQLSKKFVVAQSFDEEIQQYVSLLRYLNSDPAFPRSTYPYLSNVFKAVKNISIFALASRGHYVYEKIPAMVFGLGLSEGFARLLGEANSVFERSLTPDPDLDVAFQDCATIASRHWKTMLGEYA